MTLDRCSSPDDPDAVDDDMAYALGLTAIDREAIRLLMKLRRSVLWLQTTHGLTARHLYERLRLMELGRSEELDRASYDSILAAYLALGGNPWDFGGWRPSDRYFRRRRQPQALPHLRRPRGMVWKKFRANVRDAK